MENKIRDAFTRIDASPKLKADVKSYLALERARHERPVRSLRPRFALAAICAALLLFVGAGSFYAARTPASYISIDVNPSIELSLNYFGHVLSADALNDDGAAVLDGLELKGAPYLDAVETIVDSRAMQSYLSEDSLLTFTVASGSSDTQTRILKGLESSAGCRKYSGQCYRAELSSLSAAHDCKLSFGKYSAYLTLSQYDSSVTPEQCSEMTMAEIRALIRAHQAHGADPDADRPDNGSGHGAGHGAQRKSK